jgi:hypothetical protein
MSWQWEEDIDIFAMHPNSSPKLQWHLKWVVPADHGEKPPFRLGAGPYKVSYAWIVRNGKRKYTVRFVHIMAGDHDKTFRSLTQAKLYAVAIAELAKD